MSDTENPVQADELSSELPAELSSELAAELPADELSSELAVDELPAESVPSPRPRRPRRRKPAPEPVVEVAEVPRLRTYRARRALYVSASETIPQGALFQAEDTDPRVLAGLGQLVDTEGAPADVAAALDSL